MITWTTLTTRHTALTTARTTRTTRMRTRTQLMIPGTTVLTTVYTAPCPPPAPPPCPCACPPAPRCCRYSRGPTSSVSTSASIGAHSQINQKPNMVLRSILTETHSALLHCCHFLNKVLKLWLERRTQCSVFQSPAGKILQSVTI